MKCGRWGEGLSSSRSPEPLLSGHVAGRNPREKVRDGRGGECTKVKPVLFSSNFPFYSLLYWGITHVLQTASVETIQINAFGQGYTAVRPPPRSRYRAFHSLPDVTCALLHLIPLPCCAAAEDSNLSLAPNNMSSHIPRYAYLLCFPKDL